MVWDPALHSQSDLGNRRRLASQSRRRTADHTRRGDGQSDASRPGVPHRGAPLSYQLAMKAPETKAPRAIRTIVLADDDPFFLEAITQILIRNGYTVRTALDGLAALTLIRQVKPDCVVLSMLLSQLDGGQVCAALRQDPDLRRTPIIVFSSLGPKDYALFPDLSADAYVAKGPLLAATQNLLRAIRSFEDPEPERQGLLLGYHDFQARRPINALLLERRSLRIACEVLAPRALVLTPDGRIVMANAGACEILGRKRVEILGGPFSALLPPPVQRELHDLLAAFRRSEPPSTRLTTFQLGDRRVAARLALITEGRTCTGLVVILETEVLPPASIQPRAVP